MIWIVGGTSEATDFLKCFTGNDVSSKFIVTVVSDYSKELIKEIDSRIEVLTGRLDLQGMDDFVNLRNIEKIIDLSHPYAQEVSKNVTTVAMKYKIPYFRFHRESYNDSKEETNLYSTVEEIVDVVKDIEGNILVTLGGNCIDKFKNIKNLKNIYFRILPDSEVIRKCNQIGILPKNIIALQGPFSKAMNKVMIEDYKIKYLITKNSGINGGEKEKIDACTELGCKLIFLKRPTSGSYGEIFNSFDEFIKRIYKEIM